MKRLLILLFSLVIFASSKSLLLAWDDWTYGPIVNSISGPTTGIVGQEYTFSTNITSTEETPMRATIMKETMDPETSQESNIIIWQDTIEGSETCSPLECNITREFTPTSPGTYYLYIIINFLSAPGNETATSCNTHPEITESGCFDSRGKYITLVVEEAVEEALPETATIPTKTYILVSTGLLLLLSSSQVRKLNFSYLKEGRKRQLEKRKRKSEKKREKFEENFS